jgi:hypothetical protein
MVWTHGLDISHEDTPQRVDVIGLGSHHFGQRDPGRCVVCSDMTLRLKMLQVPDMHIARAQENTNAQERN